MWAIEYLSVLSGAVLLIQPSDRISDCYLHQVGWIASKM